MTFLALSFLCGAILGVITGAGAGVWLVMSLETRVTDRDVFFND
jgi:hypothetical protein